MTKKIINQIKSDSQIKRTELELNEMNEKNENFERDDQKTIISNFFKDLSVDTLNVVTAIT
jgi:hypothetical protein